MEILDKVALIPGANRPVGRAIAKRFADNGLSLALPCHHDWPESTEEMKQEFNSLGYNYLCVPCDLINRLDVINLFKSVSSHFGKLDYLVNNIERGGMPIVHGAYTKEINKNQWDLELDTTLKAKWNLFNYGLPLLRKSTSGAAVVNISSIAAIMGRTGPTSLLFNDGYSAANNGIRILTETWARQAAPDIRVNEIMLGLIQGRHAENTRGWSLLTPKQKTDLKNHILLKRTGLTEEVAETVFFICTKAHYITGSVIRVDGGYCLGGEHYQDIVKGEL